jgi:multiple inositol-polyphosphate phosphatase/2,3-bisphosphoglycerate 3-phosphatase
MNIPCLFIVRTYYFANSALESETGPRQPSGVFYFTHSTAIQTTLASLGIHKDYPKLLHNNYELMQKREWQTSLISPFAANIAAVFFK